MAGSSVFNDELLRQLECPVCTLYLSAPIMQCENGHNICAECRKKVDLCPTCRAQFTAVRNRLVEDIAGKLKFPCKNRDSGCKATFTNTDMSSHVLSCPRRLYTCWPGRKTGCMWEGRREQIPEHMKKNHSGDCSTEDLIKRNVTNVFKGSGVSLYKVVLVHGEVFWRFMKVDNYNKLISWYVQYVGPKENASKYKYHLKFISTDQKHNMTFENETHCDFEDEENIICSYKCVNLTYSQAEPFVDKNDLLPFEIMILKA